jgi:hypothetical protein
MLDVLFGFIGFKVPNATTEPAAAAPASDDTRQQATR